jgi:pyruvate kinase
MRRMRRAKIVATVGPSSSTPEKLRALFLAGVDVFRLNFSHGTQAEHRSRFEAIRAIEKDLGRPIGILMDLQGPKLRVGTFGAGFIELAPGQRLHLDLDAAPGDSKRVGLPHPEIFAALKKLRVVVKSCGAGWADTEVLVGGRLSDRKGVNVPDVVLPVSPLTAKDCSDLEFGLSLGADWVALSFVQRVEDIDEARTLIGERASVMAKIEKPAAIECLDAIVDRCDGLMAARGGPRGRDAAGGRANSAAFDSKVVPPRRQTMHRRDPNAGVHDLGTGTDQGRSLGCGHSGIRRRRCSYALGGVGLG